MPDLIRHPEHIEITGFPLRRNDISKGFQTFYEFVNDRLPV